MFLVTASVLHGMSRQFIYLFIYPVSQESSHHTTHPIEDDNGAAVVHRTSSATDDEDIACGDEDGMEKAIRQINRFPGWIWLLIWQSPSFSLLRFPFLVVAGAYSGWTIKALNWLCWTIDMHISCSWIMAPRGSTERRSSCEESWRNTYLI